MVYFSEIIGKLIVDKNLKKIGTVRDFCFQDGVRYAVITSIIIGLNGERKAIPWKYVGEIGDKSEDAFKFTIYLNKPKENIKYVDLDKALVSGLLDKQIIDVKGARIVRVNDLLLGKVSNKFAIIGVNTSTRGILRRVGFPLPINSNSEHIIMWKDVAPLTKNIDILQIKVSQEKLNQLHPGEIADLIRDLSLQEKVMMFNSLSNRKAAEALVQAYPDVRKTVFKTLPMDKISQLLEALPCHDAAAILNMMPTISNTKVLRLMKPGIAEKIRKLLKYKSRTAGALMSTSMITLPEDYTVKQAISLLKKEKPRARRMLYLYVIDNTNTLKGVVSLRNIIFANPSEKITDLAEKEVITVRSKADIDDVFNLMSKYELLVLPVVSKENKILGVIRVHDMFNLLVPPRIKKQRIVKHSDTLEQQDGTKNI
jgi:CBS domain-containing protein/sporulation protein YlmC with PRC-barrel domain